MSVGRNNIVVVNNNQGQQPVNIFWVSFLAFIIVTYLKWVALACFLIGAAALLLTKISREHARNEQFRRQLLAQNADLQNQMFLRGDPRGIYGLDWRPDNEGQSKTPTERGQ